MVLIYRWFKNKINRKRSQGIAFLSVHLIPACEQKQCGSDPKHEKGQQGPILHQKSLVIGTLAEFLNTASYTCALNLFVNERVSIFCYVKMSARTLALLGYKNAVGSEWRNVLLKPIIFITFHLWVTERLITFREQVRRSLSRTSADFIFQLCLLISFHRGNLRGNTDYTSAHQGFCDWSWLSSLKCP